MAGVALVTSSVSLRVGRNHHRFLSTSRHSFNSFLKLHRSAFAAVEYRPCLVTANRIPATITPQ